MIAVVGRILGVAVRDGGVAGLAGRIAVAAAARGARVELIGKLGDDPAGDATLFALSRANVGHAAILRDPTRATPTVDPANDRPLGGTAVHDGGGDDVAHEWLAALDGDEATAAGRDISTGQPAGTVRQPTGLDLAAGDLELALRYLTDIGVVILADPEAPGLVPVAVDGAGFAGAALVILGDPEALLAQGAPADATILSVPDGDTDGVFATLVAEYAVALDAGRPAAEAWATATGRLGAERA